MNYFITGIDTDSGKTLVAAILCEALKADYWKPVQAGKPTDSQFISEMISNNITTIHPEQFVLNTPASPHASAKTDGVTISLKDFKLPQSKKDLIIEGAGGCLVPLNDSEFVIDLAELFQAKIILVSDLYLGSINHTLLTINELKSRELPVKGIIFNGTSNHESERIILHHSGLRCLGRINREVSITKEIVKHYANKIITTWND